MWLRLAVSGCSVGTDPYCVIPTPLEDSMSPMALLASGIPLSLLFDLALGPESADLLAQEQEPADACG